MWIGLSEPSPGPWSCHGRPSHGSDALLCGGCGAVMLPRYPGDWLSGRAPRSHRGGHWFDPSIAHGPASAARRSLIGFAEGRDTFRGPSPRTPTICGCGPVFGFCPVGPRPPDPPNGRYRSALWLLVRAPEPRNWWLRIGVQLLFSVVTGRLCLLTGSRASPGGRDPRSPRDWWHRLAVQLLLLVLPESASARVSHPVSGALRGKPSVTVIRSSLIQTSRRP